MKVNSYTKCEINQSSSKLACTSLKPECKQEHKAFETESSCCGDVYGRAMVAMHGNEKPQTKEEVAAIVNKIIDGTGMKIGRHINDKHIHIGRPVEGFKNLCYDDMRAKCLRNNKGAIDLIYLLDNKTGEVKIYDADANLKKHFTQKDMKALKEYKYTVDELHNYLRHGKLRGITAQETLKDVVGTLDNLFNDESKVFRTEKLGDRLPSVRKYLHRNRRPCRKRTGIILVRNRIGSERGYLFGNARLLPRSSFFEWF